ncbi:MAG: hypothetical protein ACR2NU_02545 [Aeoliella sp.]
MKRFLLLMLLVLVAIMAAGLGGMYWAVTATQPYYLTALEQDPLALEEQSRQFESRFTALHSDLQNEGEWQTVISAAEINGWLALKLPESFPDSLPPRVRDPRIAITRDAVIMAARSELAGVDTVVSVAFSAFVTDEGNLAIEIKQVQAGALPLPHKEIVDKLSHATRRAGLPIKWTQNEGRKVMIIERELWDNGDEDLRVLEAIDLAEGEMFLSGRTELFEQEPSDDSIEVELAR